MTESTTTPCELRVDLLKAEGFLRLFAEGDAITFQYFQDREAPNEGGNAKKKCGHFTTTLEEAAKKLERLNAKEQCGVFFMVNEGDGKGRSSRNVSRVRALFIDLDGAPLEPVRACPLEPHAIVESSPGRFQVFWLIDGCPTERFQALQVALAEKFDSDASVNDLCRVMRVPGFYHQKREPFMVDIVNMQYSLPYSLDRFVEAMQLDEIERRSVQLLSEPLPNQEYLLAHKLTYGERHRTLLRFAAKYAHDCMEPKQIYGHLRFLNEQCSIEPKKDSEIRDIVNAAIRYAEQARRPEQFFPVDNEVWTPEMFPEPENKSSESQEKPISRGPLGHIKSRPIVAAEAFLKHHKGKIKYAKENLYIYGELGEPCWKTVPILRLKTMLVEFAKEVDPKVAPRLNPNIIKSVVDSIIILLDSERFDDQENRWLEAHESNEQEESEDSANEWLDEAKTPEVQQGRNFLRLRNGILNLLTGELLPHSDRWFSFTILPYDFEPEAKCPTFESFLQSIWPDDSDAHEALKLWCGYTLLSEVLEQKFAVFMGASRGGKGTISRLLMKLIGKRNSTACTLTNLVSKNGTHVLVGKRLAVFGDVQKTPAYIAEPATEKLISIVGQDEQLIEAKYKDIYSAELPVKLLLVCNDFPLFLNSRDALINRMLVFPFFASFANQEDRTLEDRLEKELPGFLNWAIEGARRVAAGERLKSPRKSEGPLVELKRKMDSVVAFIEDCAMITEYDPWDERSRTESATTTEAYSAYREWCEQNGRKPKGMDEFIASVVSHSSGKVVKERVRRHGPISGSRQVTVLENFKLKDGVVDMGFPN